MKISNFDSQINVLESTTDKLNIIKDLIVRGNREDAFYICDIGDIVEKHRKWLSAMPRVIPHYAVKCNDSLIVLKVLSALNVSFDCASKVEINKVLALNVDPDKVIFANPAKPASHIRHAAAVGVSMMTFDNESELYKVKTLYPDAKLVIRIRSDASEAQCPLGMKFGCDPIKEAPGLLELARDLELEVIGVSFHVGSGCKEPKAYHRAISNCRDLFDYGATLGYDFHLLDIGGGFPGENLTGLDEFADIINASLERFFPDPRVRVIAEPGRYYVTSAYTLVCNIHSKRSVVKRNSSGMPYVHNMYYINDGVYGSFNCILYDHQHIVPQPVTKNGDLFDSSTLASSSSIWGPTCDSLDQVVEDVMLPEMDIGDWITFDNMGAYTLPVASPFNGFPVPPVNVIADEEMWSLLKDILPDDDYQYPVLPQLHDGLTPANQENFNVDMTTIISF